MKRLALVMFVLAAFTLSACSKSGDSKQGVLKSSSAQVAKVGETVLTQEDVTKELKRLPEQIQGIFIGPEGTAKFVDELVKKEVLYQEARKKGIESNPEYQTKLEDFKKITLISTMLEKEIEEKTKLTDKDVKDYYDAHKDEFVANSSVKASHILVKSEEEAKTIMAQLKQGENFAKLAKEKSIDQGSAKNGGDLGSFSRGQMVPEFENAAFKLKTGELGGPIKTQYGFHIIKVTDRKTGQPVELEKVKGMLMQKMTAQKQKEVFDAYIDGLKKNYKIDIDKEAIAKMSVTDKGKEELKNSKIDKAPAPAPKTDSVNK